MISTILVGVDGSDNSDRALRWAAELGSELGAGLVAVHAVGLLEHGEPVQPLLGEIERRFAEDWCRPALQAGIAVKRELRNGSPVQVLLDVARDDEADLIVLGSRGEQRPASFSVLGSTSHEVANRSTVAVVIVPRGSSLPM